MIKIAVAFVLGLVAGLCAARLTELKDLGEASTQETTFRVVPVMHGRTLYPRTFRVVRRVGT